MVEARHILVVDDHPATRYSTSRVLRAHGFRVSEAASGMACLEAADAGIDLIILDINLPDMDGISVCRELRTRPQMARTPIVHLSAARVGEADKVRGLDAGADGYLTHPVEPMMLVSTINAFLRTRGAEDEMRRSESKFRAVFNDAPCGIALLDAQFQLVDVNPALAAAMKLRREDLLGRSGAELIVAGLDSNVAESFQAAMRRGESFTGVITARRGDGAEVQLEWQISGQTNQGEYLAIVNDITERLRYEHEREHLMRSERAARSEADRANHMKDEFMAILAHELRNPLSGIVGWSNLLKMTLRDTPHADAVAGIIRNADVQAQMIAEMLDVSRITSGKLQLHLGRADAGAIVEDVVRSLRDGADKKGVEIETRIGNGAGPLVADAARLQQVLWNLVGNAVKFTDRGGRVTIELALEAGDWLRITVRDTGFGISPEFLPHLFDRFRQQDAKFKRAGGLGLGLAIVKQLVELHSGTITATSAGENRGSTFEVRLPRAGTDSLEWKNFDRLVTQSTQPDLRGRRVLVVDDDADARSILKLILGEAGAEVEDAPSVDIALKQIARFSPDILISDIGMEPMDGYDLIREVRSRLSAQTLPAIALTAFTQDEDRERSLKAGFQLHLGKPIDPLQLLSSVRDLLSSNG